MPLGGLTGSVGHHFGVMGVQTVDQVDREAVTSEVTGVIEQPQRSGPEVKGSEVVNPRIDENEPG
jgi:hypothetical protein